MPAMFALGDKAIANATLATFAAFGSFAMLLLADFSGPMTDRLLNQAALGVACAALIALGTLVSHTAWLGAVAMTLIAFGVLFAGVVSSVLASVTTPLLLSFILPVSITGSASSIPERVGGWALAAGASLLAISLLWPSPTRDQVRAGAISACRALADRLRAEMTFMMSDGGPAAEEAHRTAIARADAAVRSLQDVFFATPYRPGGLTTDARAVIRLVDELRWLNEIVLRAAPRQHSRGRKPTVHSVKLAAADVLEQAAQLLESPGAPSDRLSGARARMQAALAELERSTVTLLPAEDGDSADGRSPRSVVSSLDPSFRAQELSFVVAQLAANTEVAAAAARRSWMDRLLGRQPAGFGGPLTAAGQRAAAYASPQSLALQNSIRGAAALGLSVLVADLSSVQHGFWVVFGTLSVLRSNALSTGQNSLRALVGTAAGFLVGAVLVYLIGTNTTLLWALLPVVVLFAGLAPSAISFAAGQASFTLTLLVLFNLIAPAGWKIGLVRVEDVALGCGVSLLVGLLFWPRGAGAALGMALGRAYTSSARYVAAAVAYGVRCCDASGPLPPPPRVEALEAAAANRRLDDIFRGYMAERGSKPAPLADVTALVTGATGVRLAADAVLDLWGGSDAPGGDRSTARRELVSAAAKVTGWYEQFAASLGGDGKVPDPLAHDEAADGRLVEAVGRDLRDSNGDATAAGVRVIWTGDHLDSVRQLQETLVGPARAATSADTRDPLERALDRLMVPMREARLE